MRKIISIDIETTGINFEKCQILSLGAVIVNLDTKQKEGKFYATLQPGGAYYFEPYALNLNRELVKNIFESNKYSNITDTLETHYSQTLGELEIKFQMWLSKNGIDLSSIKVTGKNFTEFDKKFLNRDFPSLKFNRRVFDVGSALFNPEIDDWVPSLPECLERFGLNNVVTHNALEDAEQVADLVLEICKKSTK